MKIYNLPKSTGGSLQLLLISWQTAIIKHRLSWIIHEPSLPQMQGKKEKFS